jgi:1,4-dihydroxy-2-naphthoyl-CoA hydrolase
MKELTSDEIKNLCKNTLMEHLGMDFIHVSEGKVIATMPVDNRTVQPMRRLHGGATLALAESIGSIGSVLLVDTSKFHVLGVEMNASHVGTTNENQVIATGILIHRGKSTHVWDIKVHDKNEKLISVCRLSCRILAIQTPNS